MSDPASNAQLANTLFPPPPEYYKQFTDENLERHESLSSATAGPSRSGKSPSAQTNERQPLTEEETAELERLDGTLSRPRADWIREDGRWVTFGEMLTVSLTYHFSSSAPAHRILEAIALACWLERSVLLTIRHDRTSRHRPTLGSHHCSTSMNRLEQLLPRSSTRFYIPCCA